MSGRGVLRGDRCDSWVLADCGSTATKLFLVRKRGGRWVLADRAEAPTTVEKPHADVMVGLGQALARLGVGLNDDGLFFDLGGEIT